jgi:hypothetical protein
VNVDTTYQRLPQPQRCPEPSRHGQALRPRQEEVPSPARRI